MIRYFDAHTHVQFAAYDADRKETIERALKTGVSFINVGTQADTSAAAVKLANEYPEGLYASVGLHPIHTEKSFHDEQELGLSGDTQTNADGTLRHGSGQVQTNAENFQRESVLSQRRSALGFTSREEIFDYDYYKKLALDPKVVAIGECGLDYFRIKNYKLGFKNDELQIKKKQKEAFTKQIELAIEINKPLMIHCRDAFDDLIKILKSYFLNHKSSRSPGVVHFYSGTVEDTKKLLDLGFSFTFGGVVTFPPRAGKHEGDYDEIIKMIPLDRILGETDAPYVAPAPYRGKRNEPAYVVETVKKLAEIKGIPVEEMADKIFENARGVFNIRL